MATSADKWNNDVKNSIKLYHGKFWLQYLYFKYKLVFVLSLVLVFHNMFKSPTVARNSHQQNQLINLVEVRTRKPGPIMSRFSAVYNLVKKIIIIIILRAEISPPSKSGIQLLLSEDQSEEGYYLSTRDHFWPGDTIRAFCPFLPGYTQFLQNFLVS